MSLGLLPEPEGGRQEAEHAAEGDADHDVFHPDAQEISGGEADQREHHLRSLHHANRAGGVDAGLGQAALHLVLLFAGLGHERAGGHFADALEDGIDLLATQRLGLFLNVPLEAVAQPRAGITGHHQPAPPDEQRDEAEEADDQDVGLDDLPDVHMRTDTIRRMTKRPKI